MLLTTAWLKTCVYLGCISAWTAGARPQFDTSTNMGLVLVPADAEVDSVIFRLRATDQDADFPLIFDITAAVQPIVRVTNLPCTLYNKVCQANVILTRRLVPGRLHDFAVRVRDSKGDSNSMQATISVTNATTPRDMIFPHVPSIIMVPEDTKPGKELDYLLVRANPWHGKPVYIELWQPKELFTIRQRQTPTQTRGVITLVGELDFETQSMYTLTMYATDPYTEAGKDTRNIAGVHVVVIVQDVQDVPPVFTIAPPLTRVNNSVKPGDVILRVHAEDGDKGTPREVTYGLVSEGNPLTPFFNISESTGEIILARPLEELTQITHVGAPILLTVVAEEVRRSRDEPPGQATVVELGLLLGEAGNSPPYFESDSYMAWMDENAAPGTVVMFDEPYLTRVRDEDIGKTGVFALKLGNNNGTFEITPSVAERVADFVVTVRDNTMMDYEVRKTVQFMIIAQEVGPATNLSTSVPVTIFLRDVNDNPPEFEKETYEVTLAENVLPGTRVVQVHASDKDTGSSGSIKYTKIIGPGSETLTMDSETGLILVAKSTTGLDREVTASLQLSIEARDENGKGLRSTVPLIVNLLDVNDNAPNFDKAIYEFVLNSDQTNFTSPAFIKAVDADAEPPNNEVRYELVHGNYGNKFHLNEVTGELIIREPLNKSRKRRNNGYVNFAEKFRSDFLQTLKTFQKIGVSTDKPLRIWKNRKKRAAEDVLYTLTVRAYDMGVPHRSSTAKVHVITPTPTGALTLMLVVPAEHLDPVRTTETLAAITGGRVTIQEIRPYDQPGKPGDGTAQGGRMSIVVARVEPTMSGTFLVDVETIHKSLVANGMDIVPVVTPNTNSVNESPVIVAVGNTVGSGSGGTVSGKPSGNGNVGGTPGGTDLSNGGNPTGGTAGSVNPSIGAGTKGTVEGTDMETSEGNGGKGPKGPSSGTGSSTGGNTGPENSVGTGGDMGSDSGKGTVGGPIIVVPGSTGGRPSGGSGSNTVGGTVSETVGNNNQGNTDGTGEKSPGGSSGGAAGGTVGGAAEGKGESSPGGTNGGTLGTIGGGTAGETDKGTAGGENGGGSGSTGGGISGVVVSGSNDNTGVNVEGNINKINKTTATSENAYIIYKAENKLLLWLLILLGLLMLLALLALILCCICPGCPFYMAPRKRRVHSFESVNHPGGRPKRHLRRKQVNPVRAEWSGKKQAWSADPMRRNWQFNRRNTKNRGLASLPGDVALAETPLALREPPSLRLRDGPEPWGVQYPTQKREDDRLYVEDVEGGRTYDTDDIDSLRRHEMERGSDVPRHSYHQTDETSRLPREQHFYRDGNAEVLRLVTGGHVEGEDISLQAQRPTTLVSEHQVLGYRSDGKEILLRRFIEDQKMRQHQDLHGSVQEISVEGLDPRRQGGEQFLQKHEVIILPRNLELDRRHHREEREPSVQRLIIDHGDIDNEEELKVPRHQQEADLLQQRKVAAAMLVGTAVSKAIEKPTTTTGTLNVEQSASSMNIPTYAIHDVELAKQNALLTQLLMDRDVRNLGVPGLDPGSYLETQSLPGQVAIATQTDRTAATQTENYSQVRSRSDNEESEEEIRSRRKSKSKKRLGNELRRSRSLWMRSPIQEEGRPFSETRTNLLRRKAKEAREGRRATLEPEVLREISDSLDEQPSSPSPEEAQDENRKPRTMKKAEYQSEDRDDVDKEVAGELSEIPARSSPEISKDKYHRRSHAKAVVSEVSKAESSTKKQSSPSRSKTRSQKSETKSADSKKMTQTNSEKKESDATSIDAKSNSKKKSAESQNSSEDKKKAEVKVASKSGILKTKSEKSFKKNKTRETEEALITKKRSMLKHQKAKKVSTESSEFEEIPVKSRQSSLKPKPAKQTESSSSSNLKQGPAKGKETSSVSDEPKSRSSGTDRDRVPKRHQKQSDSASSTGTSGQETTKNEKEKKVESSEAKQSLSKTPVQQELIKSPSSAVVISEKLKSDDVQAAEEPLDVHQSKAGGISDKREGILSESKSEVLKLSTAALVAEQLKPTKDDPEISEKSSDKPEKVSTEVHSESAKSEKSSSPEKELPETESENLSKTGIRIPDTLEEIGASESPKSTSLIEKEPELAAPEVSEITEKIPDNLEVEIPTSRPSISESDKNISFIHKELEASTKEVVEIGEKIAVEPEKVAANVSTSAMKLLPVEKQSDSSLSKTITTSEEMHSEPEKIPPKSDSRVTETETKTLPEEKQPELSTKEITKAFLQSEALQSSHDLKVASTEAESQSVPSTAAKSATSGPDDTVHKEPVEKDPSESTNLVPEKSADVKVSAAEVSVSKIDSNTPDVSDSKDIKSPVKMVQEEPASFVIISQPRKSQDAIVPVVSQPDEKKGSDVIGSSSDSPQTELPNKLQNDEKPDQQMHKLTEGTIADPLETSQSSPEKSPSPKYKSIIKIESKVPTVTEREIKKEADDHHVAKEAAKEEGTDRKSPEKKSTEGSEEENFPTTGSPSFYILSSTSSPEDFIPDQEITHAQISPDQTLSEKAAALVRDFSVLPTRTHDTQLKSTDLAEMRSGEWDPGLIQIGDTSSDSLDNSQPYQTPRHRSKNRTGNGDEATNSGMPEATSQLLRGEKDMGEMKSKNEKPSTSMSKIVDYELTPRLIAEEAIRSGLEEIIKSDSLGRESSSQTSSKTSPGNQNQPGETSRRKSVKEASRIPLTTEGRKSIREKTSDGSKSSKKVEEPREAAKSVRPKTEPKLGNPREGDTLVVRPRTQRGKAEVPPRESRQEPGIRRSKPLERTRQVKQHSDETKPQDLSEKKEEEGAPQKEGYMSRYKQKREEMERRRRELKEAVEEKQRPRWQRKPVVIPPQRLPVKETSKKEKFPESKTPEGATPRTRRRIKPLANERSEQLRAMVREGRKLRKAEGGDSDDPTVEIFATKPPPEMATNFQPVIHQVSYKYDKIPSPFYLHPPPPPHSSPQVSPLHVGPMDARRPDDDLDSGIAVSLQGGTKLRHQQLLEKKSVFDIAYSDAAPSQLRTDSTTPPS